VAPEGLDTIAAGLGTKMAFWSDAMKRIHSARYELLDSFRGIAILSVMLLHFCERGKDRGDSLVHERIWPVVQHGYLGVQLFFVISGYCITAALYGAMNKPQPFRYFMTRRLRRIFPPYWASMVLVVALGLVTIAVLNTPRDVVFPLTSFDWVCNVLLVQGPFHAVDANEVYWSLSIELQFYVVMGLALMWPRWTETWLVAFSFFCVAIGHLTSWPLWGTVLAYWSEFLCGIVAYFLLTGRSQRKWTPFILVLTLLTDLGLQVGEYDTLISSNGRFIKPVKLLFCFACMLLMLQLRPYDRLISRWRLVRYWAYLGLISYSLYLIHVPIGTRIFNLADRTVGLDGFVWVGCAIVAMVVCTACAALFFARFEKPWLNVSTSTSVPAPSAAQGKALNDE
jgi:peptidoglycan/LPS O-acetylase OafA/YrhL